MSRFEQTGRLPAGHLCPGTRIVDPDQADTRAPLVQVDHVSAPDAEGMVVIAGRRDDGATCRIRIAGDWPVELWTAELAALCAGTIATERARRIQAAQEPHARAFYARADEAELHERLTELEQSLAADALTPLRRAGLVWRRGLILDELTTRSRARLLAALAAALDAGDTVALARLRNTTTPADRDAIRAAVLEDLAGRAVADYNAGWFA